MSSKFVIKYFDVNLNDWATREAANSKLVTQEIEGLGLIPWNRLFVYEIQNSQIKRKWGIGLIEDEDLRDLA